LIVLDTSGLLAALLDSQQSHEAARRVLESEPRPLLLSPFVLAEVDYFLARWAGIEAEAALLDEVARGAYTLVSFDAGAVAEARDGIASHRNLMIGLADASVVVLAARYGRIESSRSTSATSGSCGRPEASASLCCRRTSDGQAAAAAALGSSSRRNSPV
jgi:predicted nucleic acid-binding protein